MAQAVATGLFDSTCTIKALPSPLTLGPSGSPIAEYATVSGLSNIACMKAVPAVALASPDVAEMKSEARQTTTNDWHVLLDSYYPTITTAMRAVVDGDTFDIVNVDNDSQFKMTRLRLREVSI